MRKKFITLVSLILSIIVFLSGCQKDESKTKPQSNPKTKTKIVLALNKYLTYEGVQKALEELKTMDKYKNIEFTIVPSSAEYLTKMPVMVASGEQLDVVTVPNPIAQAKFAESNLLQPLDKLVKELNIDYQKEFGEYSKKALYNGKKVMVPFLITNWALYYNKDIFDKAGVPYPDANKPMTWDEYRELAKKLTSGEGENKTWGALHLTWPTFWYGDAIMALNGGEKFYNEKGLSNIENPVFSRSLKRAFDMMNIDKSVPTYAEVKTGKLTPDTWLNGKYAMYLQGPWLVGWAGDKEKYPRDWKLGIAPMPVDKGTKKKTWGVITGLGVPVTSKHPKLALEVALDLNRLTKKYTVNNPIVNKTIDSPDLFKNVGETLKNDNLDLKFLKDTFTGKDTQLVTEKVTGPNSFQYELVIKEEVEKYFIKEQTLETTIKNIKVRGDKAILEK